MNLDYFIYKENNDFSFNAKEGDFITFLGEANDTIINNIIFINSNDYITLNYLKINKKNKEKLISNLGYASVYLLNTFTSETVKDEIAYVLESKAINKKEMLNRINEISKELGLEKYLEMHPLLLDESTKAKLSLARIMVSNPKILIIDNILSFLDKDDFYIVNRYLKEYISKGNIVLNFTNEIEESLLGNKLIINNKEKILISGGTLSVLNEEKIMKRLGFNLPFIVQLSKYFKDYNLIDNYILDYRKLVDTLWK